VVFQTGQARPASHARGHAVDAGDLVRARGFDGVAIGDVMKAAGFTHGGFYNHFTSKDDLAAGAVGQAFT
jgi:AcrR family transcriptional regulator